MGSDAYNEDMNFQLCKIDEKAIYEEGKEINSILNNAFNGGGEPP